MNYSAIRDNYAHGAVGDFLKQAIANNSEVSNEPDPWKNNKRKELNQIEIIDIKPEDEIEKNWADFIHKDHQQRYNDIRNAQSFSFPRRSCESFGSAIMQLDPWKENKLPKFKKLEDLHNWIQPLIEEEINFREKDIPIKKCTK